MSLIQKAWYIEKWISTEPYENYVLNVKDVKEAVYELLKFAAEHDDSLTDEGIQYNPDCNRGFIFKIKEIFGEELT